MSIQYAIDAAREVIAAAQDDDATINIERAEEDDGEFTRVFVGGKDYRIKLKIGRGSLKNLR